MAALARNRVHKDSRSLTGLMLTRALTKYRVGKMVELTRDVVNWGRVNESSRVAQGSVG